MEVGDRKGISRTVYLSTNTLTGMKSMYIPYVLNGNQINCTKLNLVSNWFAVL